MVFQKILVAIDGSKLTELMQTLLENMAIGEKTLVILSHVIVPVDVEIEADRPHGRTDEPPYHQIEEQLQIYLDKLPCQSKVEIVMGEPVEEIIRLAKIYQVDLIIIGNRGLKGISRILKGSVSMQVVEEAPCSVLVVKDS